MLLRTTAIAAVLLFTVLCGTVFLLPGRAGSELPEQRDRPYIVRWVEYALLDAVDYLAERKR